MIRGSAHIAGQLPGEWYDIPNFWDYHSGSKKILKGRGL
jgi:hypothetical protein